MIMSIEDILLAEYARQDFWTFAQGVIKELKPSTNMQKKWVLSICYELQEFLMNNTKQIVDGLEVCVDDIIFNATPRLGKTTLITDIAPLWLIAIFPTRQILVVTASDSVLKRRSNFFNAAIKTKFFKKVFPNFELMQNNKDQKITQEGGLIDYKTAGSAITGGGYHYTFCDDFLNPKDLKSKAKSETAIENLQIVFGRKEYEPNTKTVIVEQPLIGTKNVTDTVVGWWNGVLPYKHLQYPYQYEVETEYDFFKGKKLKYRAGEFVDKKFDDRDKASVIAKRGIDVFLREYMCKTIILGKIIIKREYFGYYSDIDLDKGVTECFITTDFALTDGKKSDNTVFCYWAVTKDKKLLLIDMWVLKETVGEAMQKLHAFYNKWKNPTAKLRGVSKIFIEDGSHSKTMIEYFQNVYGKFLIEVLKRTGGGSKYARYTQISGFIENADAMYIKRGGNVLLPNNEMQILGVESNHKQICEPFLSECEYFTADDRHDKDDIVDNLIDAVKYAFVDKKNNNFEDDLKRFLED